MVGVADSWNQAYYGRTVTPPDILMTARAHNPNGDFCYGFYPFRTAYYDHPSRSPALRGPGVGTRYRVNVIGPGVTPDISAEIDGSPDARNGADLAYEGSAATSFGRSGDNSAGTGNGR